MNKLLTITLVLSAIATMVPAHAVETRRQERLRLAAARQHQNHHQAQLIDDASQESALSESESDDESNEAIQNVSPTRNCKALIAATAAFGTVATAAYLYSTAEDCGNVVHAYCTGKVTSQALETCRVYWPMIPGIGTIGCWFK